MITGNRKQRDLRRASSRFTPLNPANREPLEKEPHAQRQKARAAKEERKTSMYNDPWNTNGNNVRQLHGHNHQQQPRMQQSHQRQPQRPRQIRFDLNRFNEAAEAFFENWRPAPAKRGNMPVAKILTGFQFSAAGYLMANYANPVSQKIEAWGLDVKDFREGRLTPRCFKA